MRNCRNQAIDAKGEAQGQKTTRREYRCVGLGRTAIRIASRPPLIPAEEVLTEFLTYFSGRGTLFRRKAAAVAYALRDDPAR